VKAVIPQRERDRGETMQEMNRAREISTGGRIRSFLRWAALLICVLVIAAPADSPAVPIEAPERMLESVKYLSGADLKGRGIGTTELDKAAAYIAQRFESFGLMPGGDRGGWYQEWTDPELKVTMRNVVGFLPGRDPLRERESVVIGAHYDHLGMRADHAGEAPLVHPGADDNASGVAVLVELASRLPLAENVERAVVFVAFTGEEEGRKGSLHYVRNERQFPVEKCVGMINLDTVGRLGKGKLIVLGAGSAREWTDIFQKAGKAAKLEIAPSLQELDASDQVSFLAEGVPAVQLFTGPNLDYHRPTDTADKIDADGLGKISEVARAAALYLAITPKPLTPTLTASRPDENAPRVERKVTVGIIPDFTYNESGVRLGGVAPGSPAEAAGLRQGDVIIKAGARPVAVLKDLSDALKASGPGDRLAVTFLRHGQAIKVDVKVRER
jgi:aminopeptidase N